MLLPGLTLNLKTYCHCISYINVSANDCNRSYIQGICAIRLDKQLLYISAIFKHNAAGSHIYIDNSLLQIPKEMEESATMDGSSKINTFFKIILPLAAPGIFTAAIIIFIGAWNEFLLSLTLNTNEAWRTATVNISFLRGQFEIFWGQVTAATVVVTIPT